MLFRAPAPKAGVSRQFHHARRPAGVVVGARVRRARHRRGQRELLAQPEMVVMGADHHILLALTRHNPNDILHRLDLAQHVDVEVDLGAADIPMPLQTRLTGLAHRHHTALVCLTEKDSAAFSLGSLVSLRAHAEKKTAADNHFTCALRVLKDKRRGPTWSHEELYTGPAGLC